MKIYEVKYTPINTDGWEEPLTVLNRFLSEDDALNFKKEQEDLWQKHFDNNECISPCWYDRKKELVIDTIDIKVNVSTNRADINESKTSAIYNLNYWVEKGWLNECSVILVKLGEEVYECNLGIVTDSNHKHHALLVPTNKTNLEIH